MTHTPTLPLDDRRMWRKAVAALHPDRGGDHETCVWIQAVRDVVCNLNLRAGANPEAADYPPRRRKASTYDEPARVPFAHGCDFAALTGRALRYEAGEYSPILALLRDCWPLEHLAHEQERGASYKRLALVAHLVGMSKPERVRWYRVAEEIPLSDRHAGHLITRLKGQAAC